MLLRRWAAEMPGVAAAWLSQKEESPLRQESSLAVATVWADRKAGEAADWVRQWPAEQKEAGLLAVAFEAARKSPQEALWLAADLPPGDARDGLVHHAVSQWASADPATSLAWAAKMEASPLRDQVIERLSLGMSETDPQGAAELAIQTLPEGKKQNDVVIGIVQRWVQKEPDKAAEWVAAFPEGGLRETAVQNLVSIWADQSPQEAADWLGQLDEGQARDGAISALSGKLAASSPPAAAAWIESISDPERRQRELEMLGERWLTMDRQAASEWLQNAALPEPVKTRLLARPPAKPETQ